MAISNGLTSAITNPIAAGVREAVMAADVLMGNDQDAARWIRTHRVAVAEGEAGGRRVNRRRAGIEPPRRIAGTEAVSAAGG
jgi:5-methyltetrahydrofolate--homocysteine methyltransferase